jgi:YD repeat-containing protein
MKNLKTIISMLAVTLIIILSSCSKSENDSIPIPAEAIYRIKEISGQNGVVVSRYTYNTAGKLEKIAFNNGQFLSYEYNTKGLLILAESAGNPNPTENNSLNYTYDVNGVKTEQINKQNNINYSKIVYTINSSGLPTESKLYYWYVSSSSWIEDINQKRLYFYNAKNQLIRNQKPVDYALFLYDERGNLIESKSFFQQANGIYILSFQDNLTFDDKKSHNLYPELDKQINNQLIKTSKLFDQDGNVTSQSQTNSTYDYNEAGYVTKMFTNGALTAIYTLEKMN